MSRRDACATYVYVCCIAAVVEQILVLDNGVIDAVKY